MATVGNSSLFNEPLLFWRYNSINNINNINNMNGSICSMNPLPSPAPTCFNFYNPPLL